MGASLGCIKFKDGTILFAGYQNTSDVMNHCLWKTLDDALNKYSDDRPDCDHVDNGEPVCLATDYGGGFSWSGRACKSCMVITKGHSPFPVEGYSRGIVPAPAFYEDGLPGWWPKIMIGP